MMNQARFLVAILLVLSIGVVSASCPGSTQIRVHARSGFEYWLEFTNRENVQYSVPFAEISNGNLRYGRDDTKRFITQETDFDTLLGGGSPEDAFNIRQNDIFLVSAGGDYGTSRVLEYASVDLANQFVAFQDLASGPVMTKFVSPAPDKDPNTVLGQFSLTVGGYSFTGYIFNQAPYPLAIDLDGDGVVNGAQSMVILRGGGLLDIGANDGPGTTGSIPVSLTTPSRSFRNSRGGDESLEFTITKKNSQVSLGNIAYFRNSIQRTATSIPSFELASTGNEHWYGATDYGVLLDYYKPASVPEEISIDYPGLGECARAPAPILNSPEKTTSACQDSDDFNPYVKGTVSGPAKGGKTLTVTDACQASPESREEVRQGSLVREGLCNSGLADFLLYRCMSGCENGACKVSDSLFDGASWSCTDDQKTHAKAGCLSEKDLFEAAQGYCTKNCNYDNCRVKGMNLGVTCDPKQIPEEQPVPETKPEPPVCDGCIVGDACILAGTRLNGNMFCDPSTALIKQREAGQFCQDSYECLSNMCEGSVCVNPVPPQPPTQQGFFQRVWNWFSGIFK